MPPKPPDDEPEVTEGDITTVSLDDLDRTFHVEGGPLDFDGDQLTPEAYDALVIAATQNRHKVVVSGPDGQEVTVDARDANVVG
jgi:hypothetical protein